MVLLCSAVLPVTQSLDICFFGRKEKFKRRVQMTKVTLENRTNKQPKNTSENCLDQSPQHISIYIVSVC